MSEARPEPARVFADIVENYGGKDLPLRDYMALTATYGTLLAALIAVATRTDSRVEFGLGKLLLLGVSTHQFSRLVTKDKVTAPFRAPFVKFVKSDGSGEVEEEARGRGLQRAIGDLVTCPFCVNPWLALVLIGGLFLAPRATRIFCTILTASALANFLHHAYVALENHKEPA